MKLGNNPRAKKLLPILIPVLVVILVLLYFLKGRILIEKNGTEPQTGRSQDQEHFDSSIDYSKPSGISSGDESIQESSFPYEDDNINEEWIQVESVPYRVYFRGFTLTLEECIISKDRCGQPEPVYCRFDDEIEYGDTGKILSAHSYVHIRFLQKNEGSAKASAYLSSSRLFVSLSGEEKQRDFLEVSMMNKIDGLEDRDYYHVLLDPGVEQEFTVTYIIPDEYTSDDYDLNYGFNPRGSVDYIDIGNGKQKIVEDAKVLLLDRIATNQ